MLADASAPGSANKTTALRHLPLPRVREAGFRGQFRGGGDRRTGCGARAAGWCGRAGGGHGQGGHGGYLFRLYRTQVRLRPHGTPTYTSPRMAIMFEISSGSLTTHFGSQVAISIALP